MFDAGLSSPSNSDYIFLTHGHSDHSASLYFHTLAPVPEGKRRIIYTPFEILDKIKLLLKITCEVSNDTQFEESLATYEVIGVSGGDRFKIVHNGIPHLVEVYDNDHSVPCRSYGLQEQKKCLKEEYRFSIGKPGLNNSALNDSPLPFPRVLYLIYPYVCDCTNKNDFKPLRFLSL